MRPGDENEGNTGPDGPADRNHSLCVWVASLQALQGGIRVLPPMERAAPHSNCTWVSEARRFVHEVPQIARIFGTFLLCVFMPVCKPCTQGISRLCA